jgi:predicted XRE-type DNA-binding protein
MASADSQTVRALRLDVAYQIGRQIRHSGSSQLAIARYLGIPQPTVSKIVNGRVSELSLELLVRIAIRAGLVMTLQTGRVPQEAGAFVSGRSRPRSRTHASAISEASRASLTEAERALTPPQRMEAFLEHNQLLAELHVAGHSAEVERVSRGRPK